MAYFETYCDPISGSNLNGGSDAGAPSMDDSAAGTGGYVSGTHIYTSVATTGSVAIGQLISIWTGALSVATCIARITAVSGGSGSPWVITISSTAFIGALPTTNTNYKAIVGGAWQGPNAAVSFPSSLISTSLVNVAGSIPRVNMKNNGVYSISAAWTIANAGITYQGFTSTAGDGGKAVVDGSTNAINLFSCAQVTALNDLIFQNNGTTGTNAGLLLSNIVQMRGLIVRAIRGAGISCTSAPINLIECEVYGCNQANSANSGGVLSGVGINISRCMIHDNAGSNNNGVVLTGNSLNLMISYSSIFNNGNDGALLTGASFAVFSKVDLYNNTRDGFEISGSAMAYIDSVNMVLNGRFGFETASSRPCFFTNCAYGSGTQANVSGTTSGPTISETGAITLTANTTPWSDPVNGDFTITNTQCQGTGRGVYTESLLQTGTITNATNASPIVLSSVNTLTVGTIITVSSVGGNTNANATWTVSAVSGTTITLLASSGNAPYTSGGTWTTGTGTYSKAANNVAHPDVGNEQHLGGGATGSNFRGGFCNG